MTKEEETELSKWVLSNKYFSPFIFYNDDQIDFISPPIRYSDDCFFKKSSNCFFTIDLPDYSCAIFPKNENDVDGFYYKWESMDEMMEKLSLEDAKKYVVELAKYGIMRENEEKKAKILKNLNDL